MEIQYVSMHTNLIITNKRGAYQMTSKQRAYLISLSHNKEKENKEKLEQPREEIVTQKVQNEDRGNKNRRK